MSFGLKNATSTFTRTMSKMSKRFGNNFLKFFIDDFNVNNESWDEHLQHLHGVFFKFRKVSLKLNLSKCCFVAKSITFLGHIVNNEGTKPNFSKINVVFNSQIKNDYQHLIIYKAD
jgi:hypothetical protein